MLTESNGGHASGCGDNMTNRASLGCALLMVLGIFGCGRPASDGPAEVGRTAPNFTVPDLSGRKVSLDQYRGRVVILDFWATWCGPCRMSMPVLEQLQQQYSKNLALLAINIEEPPELVKNYVQRQKISSTVLLDQDGKIGRTYHSDSIPMQVLIDKDGVIRHIQVGYSPGMATQLRDEINKLL
jgi:thiol-disulfide isomerase/thioredoxin